MRASSAAIFSGRSTKSTQPAAMALIGMPGWRADDSSWAKVMPPSALMASKPRVPSEAIPLRITPTAALIRSSASEHKKLSMGRCFPAAARRRASRRIPSRIVMSALGGIT